MNGVHDMGGMQDFGPIRPEKNEPVFHKRWEGRMIAIYLATGAWGKWNIDASRHQLELLSPADYLGKSYYQKWLLRMLAMAVRVGFVTSQELESGRPAKGMPKAIPPLTAANVASVIAKGASKRRDVGVLAKFQAGQRIRARNINPLSATRLPRYARGKVGTVEHDHGVFVFPDSNAQGLGEKPQHVYTVRFAARELWGDAAKPNDTVIVAMWDDYLEPV